MKTQFLLLFALMAAGGLLSAQQTTYVATYGSNGNSCTTVTQPCATFIGAYSKAGPGGTILALDSGDFGFLPNITHPIIVDGGAHGAFIGVLSSGPGVIVNLPSPPVYFGGVTLRNLSIVMQDPPSLTGQTGIQAGIASGFLVLDHVSVIGIQDTLNNTLNGIEVDVAPGASVDLKDVTVSGVREGINLFDAFNITAPFTANLENVSVRALDNALIIADANANIRNSSFRGPNRTASGIGVALYVSSTSPNVLIENTKVANNSTGISVTGGTLRLSNDVITGNGTGLSSTGATVISYRNNTFAGNTTDGSPLLSTSVK